MQIYLYLFITLTDVEFIVFKINVKTLTVSIVIFCHGHQNWTLSCEKNYTFEIYGTVLLLHFKGLNSWLSFVVSNCEFVTFPLVSWVRCGT